MQKLTRYFLVFAFALISSNAFAGRTAPLTNIENMPVVTGSDKAPSADQVRQAIVYAVNSAKWTATPAQDGKMIASIEVRNKHTLTVEIAYNATSYSIRYKDSINLNHGFEEDVEVIHPNANKWMVNLKEAIRNELIRL